MVGDELRVAEHEPAGTKAGDEVDEGDLAGVGLAVKHRLAEEHRAECEPVEATDESLPIPDFDRVAEAAGEELAIEIAQGRIDPGRLPVPPTGYVRAVNSAAAR